MIRKSGIKRSKLSKTPKTSLRIYKKKLWKKFADFIKFRDGNVCFICLKPGLSGSDWHAGHLFSAADYSALRWTFEAVRSNCYGCNVGRRGNYIEYHARYKQVFGQEAYDALYNRRKDFKQWRLPDLMEVEAAIDREYEKLKAQKIAEKSLNSSEDSAKLAA